MNQKAAQSRLYVGNISFDTAERDLHTLFSQDGLDVEHVKIVLDHETQRSRGFAFVQMASNEDAARAKQLLNDTVFKGRTIHIEIANQRPAPRQHQPSRDDDDDDRHGRRDY